VRGAAPQRGEDVAQGRGLRAGDDADGAREQRQRALALLVEQALVAELSFRRMKASYSAPTPARRIASTLIW
jgi:hypothetical protein